MSGRLALLALAAALDLCGVCGIATAQQPDSLNPMRELDRAALANFVELPLFDPARRLPPPPPPAPVVVNVPAPPPAEQPPTLQLVGIIRGKRDLAIVHQNGAEKTVILRNGELLDGWTIVVNALGVTLKNGDRSIGYAIFAPSAGGTPPPPPAPVAVDQTLRRHPDQ